MSSISEKDIVRTLMDSTDVGLSVQDRDFNILFQNAFLLGVFGRLGGKCYQVYEHRQTRCEVCAVEQAFRDGRSHTTVRRATLRGGDVVHLETIAMPIRDAQGAIVAGLEIVRDVTAHEQSQKDLEESERRLATLIGNLPGLVYRCRNDSRWTMEYLSSGCLALTGHPPESLIGNAVRSYNDLIHPEDRPRVWRSVQEALAEKRPYQIAYRLRTAEGQEKWVWERGRGIVEGAGQVVALEGFITDITERKKAEESMVEQERFLSSIVDNLPDAIFIKDAAELRFVRVNKAGQEFLGYSQAELRGKNDYDFFPREQADFFTAKDRETLARGQILDIPEEPISTRNGHRILHTKKIPILDEGGRAAYLLVIAEDITARKQAEQERERLQAQLAQAQKMESVGRLAGGVAHDFNNMLGVIIGYAELALEAVRPTDPLYASLQEIHKAAGRSAELTRQLLAFARKQTVAPRVLDLNETVEGLLKMLRRLIGEDINLVWSPGTGVRAVKMDPSQLDQILANLCVNARDAIAGTGWITIETRMVTLDEHYCRHHPECSPGEYAQLAVSDSGCGIPGEVLDRLFEPFFTTKEPGKGTGLGLATVYGIVKQNNGHISVYSEPGHGSTFKVYLPCRGEGGETSPGPRPAAQSPRGDETILLVEDEQALLAMGRSMLESQGYRVLSAGTPREALALAARHPGPIHLLLTDVVMPEMNGKELSQKLAALHPELRCLFASGYSSEIIGHHGVLEDDLSFLEKPFSRQELARKVREVLDKKA